MKFELELIRAGRVGQATVSVPRAPTAPSRKAIREATDLVLLTALRQDNLQALVASLCDTMLTVARVVDTHDCEPQVEDFVEAASALVEDGRSVLDRGLMLNDWATAKCGAVMLELTIRGICAATSVPYEDAMRAIFAGEPPPLRVPGANADSIHTTIITDGEEPHD